MMDKLPVYIITSREKIDRCSIWYIPYCPFDIEDVDEWYAKITTFIDDHSSEYSTLYVPNTIQYSPARENVRPPKHLFVIAIGSQNKSTCYAPEGYHTMYCLQRDMPLYESQTNTPTLEELAYEHVSRVMFILMFLVVLIAYLCQ